jgi:hypothetical protein
MAHQLKAVIIKELFNVAPRSGEKIVEANYTGAVFEQSLTEMGAKKTGSSGDEDASFEVHV